MEVADCLLQFPGGAIATLSASRASQRKVRTQLVSTPTALYDVDLLRQDLTVYRHRAHAQGVGDGQAAGYRAETVIDIPFVRHTGEPLALQFAHFLDLVSGRTDACAERNSILPAHEVAAAIEECS
jgi:predicted dehydrogenase